MREGNPNQLGNTGAFRGPRPVANSFFRSILAASPCGSGFCADQRISQPRKFVETKILAGGKKKFVKVYIPLNHADLSACRDAAFTALTASTTRCPISVVEIAAWVFPARSAVRAPCASTAATAFSTQAASFSK